MSIKPPYLPDAPVKPRERLLTAAEAWSDATGRSLGALASIVANYGGALERLRDPDKPVTDATLEKFAHYLGDPTNWPEQFDSFESLPESVRRFVIVTGVTLQRNAA